MARTTSVRRRSRASWAAAAAPRSRGRPRRRRGRRAPAPRPRPAPSSRRQALAGLGPGGARTRRRGIEPAALLGEGLGRLGELRLLILGGPAAPRVLEDRVRPLGPGPASAPGRRRARPGGRRPPRRRGRAPGTRPGPRRRRASGLGLPAGGLMAGAQLLGLVEGGQSLLRRLGPGRRLLGITGDPLLRLRAGGAAGGGLGLPALGLGQGLAGIVEDAPGEAGARDGAQLRRRRLLGPGLERVVGLPRGLRPVPGERRASCSASSLLRSDSRRAAGRGASAAAVKPSQRMRSPRAVTRRCPGCRRSRRDAASSGATSPTWRRRRARAGGPATRSASGRAPSGRAGSVPGSRVRAQWVGAPDRSRRRGRRRGPPPGRPRSPAPP